MRSAGWYQDPEQKNYLRYWNGTNWTDQTQPYNEKESFDLIQGQTTFLSRLFFFTTKLPKFVVVIGLFAIFDLINTVSEIFEYFVYLMIN